MSSRLLVVTGISGSGRSTCLRALEDLGWFCVDNLPASLLPAMHEAMADRTEPQPVAVGIDVRAGAFLDDIDAALSTLEIGGISVELLYVDCADDVLLRRFAETRRKHPILAAKSIEEAIRTERQHMLALRERTALVIDTSDLNIHQLKAKVGELFGEETSAARMHVSVRSFGFKHGLSRDADYVFDVRCLANPHFVPHLRPQTGLSPAVAAYVMKDAGGQAYLDHIIGLLGHTLPLHQIEGRALVTIAIGCTGGQHRSVALAQEVAAYVRGLDIASVTVSHRDRPHVDGEKLP
ncbi:MAG: RNase adapter RapZ [Myxococcales bacterium]|nr:RNase adapter RapZ [Myxococcales bacterium]